MQTKEMKNSLLFLSNFILNQKNLIPLMADQLTSQDVRVDKKEAFFVVFVAIFQLYYYRCRCRHHHYHYPHP